MKKNQNCIYHFAQSCSSSSPAGTGWTKAAADDAAAIAKKLANPIGALISLPFQNNMDIAIGDYNGSRNTLNIQPIVPLQPECKIQPDYTIYCPVIAQYDITGEDTRQSGLQMHWS